MSAPIRHDDRRLRLLLVPKWQRCEERKTSPDRSIALERVSPGALATLTGLDITNPSRGQTMHQTDNAVEEWRPVAEWEGLYEVSSLGRVRSLPRTRGCGPGNSVPRTWPGKMLTMSLRSGYPFVILRDRGRASTMNVHRLVMLAFAGPEPDGCEVRHLDNNPANARLDNLRWGTHRKNMADKLTHGTVQKGERHPAAKFTDEKVRAVRRRFAEGEKIPDLAREYGFKYYTVYQVVMRKTWLHVEGQ